MAAEAYRIAGAGRRARRGHAGRLRARKEGRVALRPPAPFTSSTSGFQTSSMYACSLPSPGRGPSLMMRV